MEPSTDILGTLFGGLILLVLFVIGAYSLLDRESSLKLRIYERVTGRAPNTCQTCRKLIPWNRSKCSRCIDREALRAFGGLLGAAVGVFVAAHLVRAGFSFLKGIDLNGLNTTLQRAIQGATSDFESIKINSDRLSRAERLLQEGDKISVDQAAMLSCATMEAGLRTLCTRHSVAQNTSTGEGMVDIALRLSERGVISSDELRRIKTLVFTVRNPVMHGNFDSFHENDVRAQIQFTREFFKWHRLANGA